MTPTALRPMRPALVAMALALLLAACSGAAITPLPSGAQPPANCARVNADGVIEISADDLEFSAPCMVANAGEPFTIHFVNNEAQVHNVSLYTDGTRATEIMRPETITGPNAEIDYPVEAMEAGEYYFDCFVHPAMNGPLWVL